MEVDCDLNSCQVIELLVKDDSRGRRLDQFLGHYGQLRLKGYSRSRFQQLIHRGLVLIDGLPQKAGYKLRLNDKIQVFIPPPEPVELVPEKIDFEIIHEDDDLLVLSKPPGVVVHPAAGNPSGTLVNGILYHCRDLKGIGGEIRPGIVHRLDKDTSGVMVVAKNDLSLNSLMRQFKDRKVRKIYHALLAGCLPEDRGRLVSMIGRHPVNRKKMAILERGGKEAITNWRVLARLKDDFTLVEILLETGRTHQIRVHMASCGAPVAGDEGYGKKKSGQQPEITRQCLHASILSFNHPVTGEELTFRAPLWPDLEAVLRSLDFNFDHLS